MKTFLFTAGLLASLTASASSTDTLYVKQQQLPILIERTDNVLFLMRMNGGNTQRTL